VSISREDDYCEMSNFTTNLDDCLNCADEFNIWEYYGESIEEAAEDCGLEATPVAASNTASSTDAASASASAATSSVMTTETAEASSTASADASSVSEVAEAATESVRMPKYLLHVLS
jgi:hypothetical protein